jgi:hypothetical protein
MGDNDELSLPKGERRFAIAVSVAPRSRLMPLHNAFHAHERFITRAIAFLLLPLGIRPRGCASSICAPPAAATVTKMVKDHLLPDMRMSGDLTDFILRW